MSKVRNTTYWKADKETSKKIKELLEKLQKSRREAYKLAKSFGALGCYESLIWGDVYFMGFKFKKDVIPDQKIFCRMKQAEDGWRPRHSSKEGKELHAKLRAMTDDSRDKINKLVAAKTINGELSETYVGAAMVGNIAYLQASEGQNLKGCTRISDLDYEKAFKKKKKPIKN